MTPYPEDALAAPQPTQIRIKEVPFFEAGGEVLQPPVKTSLDENFGIETEYFDGIADFEVPVRIASGATPGDHELVLQVRFMACNDRLCLPPQDVEIATVLVVSGTPATLSSQLSRALNQAAMKEPTALPAIATEAQTQSSPPSRVQPPPADPLGAPATTLAYILFAMAGGGLALLTPCVFPMIPITVSYFTKREVSRRQALYDAALYSLGIILTFTVLGFALTLMFGAGGINRVAASPSVNIAIAALFVVFALSLFGAIELSLPSGWLTAVDKKSSAAGGSDGNPVDGPGLLPDFLYLHRAVRGNRHGSRHPGRLAVGSAGCRRFCDRFCGTLFLSGSFPVLAEVTSHRRLVDEFPEGDHGLPGIGCGDEVHQQRRSCVSVGAHYSAGFYYCMAGCGSGPDALPAGPLFVSP